MWIVRLLTAIVAATYLVACCDTSISRVPIAATATPTSQLGTPAPVSSAAAGSHLTAAGDMAGEVLNIVPTCGLRGSVRMVDKRTISPQPGH